MDFSTTVIALIRKARETYDDRVIRTSSFYRAAALTLYERFQLIPRQQDAINQWGICEFVLHIKVAFLARRDASLMLGY